MTAEQMLNDTSDLALLQVVKVPMDQRYQLALHGDAAVRVVAVSLCDSVKVPVFLGDTNPKVLEIAARRIKNLS